LGACSGLELNSETMSHFRQFYYNALMRLSAHLKAPTCTGEHRTEKC
jgi:hypothetical protein